MKHQRRRYRYDRYIAQSMLPSRNMHVMPVVNRMMRGALESGAAVQKS
jgi:hypothetical protein